MRWIQTFEINIALLKIDETREVLRIWSTMCAQQSYLRRQSRQEWVVNKCNRKQEVKQRLWAFDIQVTCQEVSNTPLMFQTIQRSTKILVSRKQMTSENLETNLPCDFSWRRLPLKQVSFLMMKLLCGLWSGSHSATSSKSCEQFFSFKLYIKRSSSASVVSQSYPHSEDTHFHMLIKTDVHTQTATQK